MSNTWEWKQPISKEIFLRKYDLHNEGNIESIYRSIADEIASCEKKEIKQEVADQFYDMLINGYFIPAGRIMANARLDSPMKNYNNCFTIEVKDSIDSIYDSLKEDAKISKMGGGVGFNASHIRPKGAVLSKGGEASGVISFLKVFDASAKVIMTGGQRRCLPENSWINTKEGMKKIQNIVVGEEILTSNKYEKVKNVFNQGIQETIIIKTENGDFECTSNHKMPVFDSCFSYKWKQAKDLTSNDKLVFVSSSVEGKNTELPPFSYTRPPKSTTSKNIIIPELDEEIAWFFGYLFGNGHVHLNETRSKGKISMSVFLDHNHIVRKLEKIFTRFGINPITKQGTTKQGKGKWWNVTATSNQLGIYFSQFKQSNTDMVIPNFIMQGLLQIRASFLAGLFDADGSCKCRPLQAVSSVYPNLVKDTVALYSSLGINLRYKFKKRKNPKWKDICSVNIPNAKSVKLFNEIIAPLSLKYFNSRKTKIYGHSNTDNRFSREMFLKENINYRGKWAKGSKNITLPTLERILEEDVNLIPIQVLSLEQGREVLTYDLEVENKHEFVCNGFLTHNSAHIAVLNVDHPDIEEFITCKHGDENKVLTQFNISVGITDAFIKAVEEDADWDLVFEGEIFKTVKAKYLYDLMVKNAYKHNEPGIFNLDTVNKYNNGFLDFPIEEVNPCGEICMPKYGLCCLGALNYSKFIVNPFTDEAYIDFKLLEKVTKLGVRFLDNVLDVADYPLPKIEKQSKEWRRIGVGFTGFADALTMLKVKYGDNPSKKISFKLAKALRDNSYEASIELAKEKKSFTKFDSEKILQSQFVKKLPTRIKKGIKKHGLRNIALNTTAPTGTISLSIGQNCSSGIEPIFAFAYDRNIRTGTGDETRKERVYDNACLIYDEKFGEGMDYPDYFVTTLEVNPYDGVDIQAIFQKYIDHSISKTANLPKGFTFDEYKDLFMYSYKKGLKGFTSFNPEGSMKGILEYEDSEKGEIGFIDRTDAPKRPKTLDCDIHIITVSGVKFIVLTGKYNGSLYEIFVTNDKTEKIDLEKYKKGFITKMKKGVYNLEVINGEEKTLIEDIGGTFDNDMGTLARLISMSLRHGTPLQFVVDQLARDKNFYGFERAVSRVLKKYIKDGEKVLTSEACPECQNSLIYKEGCMACSACGFSKCA